MAHRNDRYASTASVKFDWKKVQLPGGLLSDHRIDRFLIENLSAAGYSVAGDFDRLPIPFRAVAGDLATGDEVVLAHGDLALAVRASMSIPLVFPPVEWGAASDAESVIEASLRGDRLFVTGLGYRVTGYLGKDKPRFFAPDGQEVNRARFDRNGVDLALRSSLERWGSVEVGVRFGRVQTTPRVGIDIPETLSLVSRLATSVPPPRFHTVRYAGVLAGGRMRLLAMVQDPANVARLLAAMGEPTELPRRSPGRGPPYWKSRVLRRQALGDEDDAQGRCVSQTA